MEHPVNVKVVNFFVSRKIFNREQVRMEEIIFGVFKKGVGLWKYFLRSIGDRVGEYGKCIVEGPDVEPCNKILTMGKKKSPTALQNHLIQVHKIRSKRPNDRGDEEVVPPKKFAQFKANGFRFSLTMDEWTSIRGRKYANVNLHCDGGTFCLGLVRSLAYAKDHKRSLCGARSSRRRPTRVKERVDSVPAVSSAWSHIGEDLQLYENDSCYKC